MKKSIISLLKIYKLFLSPILESLFGKGCRFAPTCSEFAALAIEKKGIWLGGKMALIRILHCHSFSNKTDKDLDLNIFN